MFNFLQSTPRYQGEGQPAVDACGGGLFGMLTAFLGGGLFPRAPEYKSAPINGKASPAELPSGDDKPEPQEPEPEPILGPDSQQNGPVTIVISPGGHG
jgi:hypothetical protein